MSSDTEEISRIDKGKARASETAEAVSETTPLLAQPSNSALATLQETEPSPSQARRRLWSKLALVFFITLSLCVVVFIIIAIVAYAYASRVSDVSSQDLLKSAVVLRGPDRVDVLNITSSGDIWLQVEGRIGVDAGAVIDVHSDEDDGFWQDVWKSLGRWGIRQLGAISLEMDSIHVFSVSEGKPSTLTTIQGPPLDLPLTSDPPTDLSWLTTISAPVLLRPTNDSTTLIRFVRDSWKQSAINVQVNVPKVIVRGGVRGETSLWKHKLDQVRSNISTSLRIKIPHIPGLPNPDRHSSFPPLSQLVTLCGFQLSSTSKSSHVLINANATVIDPAPENFYFTTPALPFTVSLPSANRDDMNASIPVASVHTEPFSLSHPNITLHVAGHVLPLSTSPSSTATFSRFLNHYLSAQASPIIITTPYLPNVTFDTVFPAPSPRPRLLRDVTIRDMRIKPIGSRLFASGIVFARVVLPKGMNVGVSVNRVLPDVLVFDGEVPDGTPDPRLYSGERIPTILPDPLPERAFGRIRPEDWLDALSVREDPPADSDEEVGAIYAVSAKVVDVPLQVLPGRQKEFSNFVGKVVFGSSPAVAGLLGTADVAVDVFGLSGGDMELTGLPFRGTVRVGKGSP